MSIGTGIDLPHEIRGLRKALLNWYPFRKTDRVLLLGRNTDVLYDLLREVCAQVTLIPADEIDKPVPGNRQYDAVVAADLPDDEPARTSDRLKSFYDLLAPDGTLLLGFRNRFGLKYLCGSLDHDIPIPFSGIIGSRDGIHLYGKQEMNALLSDAGFASIRYYYPMPDADFAQAVYTDEYLPEGSIRDRVFPYDPYHSPFLMPEADLYDDMVREKALPFTANYYLAECRKASGNGSPRHVIYAALSTDRGPRHGFATILYSDGTCCKKALSEEGRSSLETLYRNLEELHERGILTVDQKLTEDGIIMPLVREPASLIVLQKLLHTDRDAFLKIFSDIYDDVLRSSEPGDLSDEEASAEWGMERDALGPVLKKAFIDMIPYNAFRADGKMRYYDQEFTVSNCPALYVLFRALRYTWLHIREAETLFPLEEAKAYFGLTPLWDAFLKREDRFVADNRNYEKLEQLYKWAAFDRGKMAARREALGQETANYFCQEQLLADIHTVQLRLLKKLDRVCRENGLQYMAIHGTLLGAVRHHGFIPWDADIDIAMPRTDYDRLLEMGRDAFPHPFFLQTALNNYGCYYGGYSKLRYDGTAALEPQNEGAKCHQGIWIDIFPIDCCPAPGGKRERLFRTLRFLQRIIFTKAYGLNPLVIKDVSPGWRCIFWLLSKCTRRQDLVRLFDHLCRGAEKSGEKTLLSCYYGNRPNRNIWLAETTEKTVMAPFEDMQLPIPAAWEEILGSRYGRDFMVLPTEDRRRWNKEIQFYPNLRDLTDGE